MAWTDQCRIAAVETINKVAEDTGVSVRKAIAEVSKAADIPPATLQRWYYPRNEVKNDPTSRVSQGNVKNDVPPTSDDYTMAIEQLRRIKNDDPVFFANMVEVVCWINNRLQVHSR